MRQTTTRQVSRKTLAGKIGFLVTVMLIIIFSLLIVITLTYTRNAITKATYNDLHSNSRANGNQVQEFMNVCQTVAKSLRSQIEFSLANPKPSTEMETSQVYSDLKLDRTHKELESYLIGSAINAVRHNSAVIGIGIMFEPYQFTKDRESYALYFTEENGEIGVSDVGAYEEFSVNEYYQISVGKTDTSFPQPYLYRDMWMVTGSTPLIVNGKMIGVINVDVTMDEFNKLNLTSETYPSMAIDIVSGNGTIAFDSKNADSICKNMSEVIFSDQKEAQDVLAKLNSTESFDYTYKDISGEQVQSFFYPLKAGGEMWQTITTVSTKDLQRASVQAAILLLVICIASLVIIVLVVLAALRKNLSPINQIVTAAEHIADGHLDISLDVRSDDEVGVLSKAFLHTCDSLKEMITDISVVLGRIAQNDLNVASSIEYKGDFVQIHTALDSITTNLNHVVYDISQSAEHVSHGSNQISGSSQALSQGAVEQAGAIEELSATIGTISSEVEKTADSARITRKESESSKAEIERCNSQMADMIVAMSLIKEKSSQISKIIKTVEDIAFQTNILALNAAVEAARAGAAGKGFAVVADEVRNLAGKSAEAVKDTTSLIEETINAVENGVSIADGTAKSMSSIVEDNNRIVAFMDSLAVSSGSLAESISQITSGIENIAGVIHTNSATAEQSAAASQELSSQAQMLKSLVNRFRLRAQADQAQLGDQSPRQYLN